MTAHLGPTPTSHLAAGRAERRSAIRLRSLLATLKPPLRDRRFWLTQALVATIAISHDSVEMSGLSRHLGMEYFLPISLFFIPVVYAAVYFGLSGSIATALACTILAAPNLVLWHNGSQRIGIITQLFIVNAIALFVGTRVDRQMKARAEAEEAEQKYRGLFETAGEAILVLDKNERVVECNTTATTLLGRSLERLQGQSLQELFSPEISSVLRAVIRGTEGTRNVGVLLERADGDTWIEPVSTRLPGQDGLTQVVLRDVTEQRRRQAGLETYAALILNAQEEERKRVAQELHDDTVQSLLVLCRMLDDDEAGIPNGAYRYAESIVESLRGFARGLRPPALDDLGLGPALEKLVSEVTSRSAIEGQLVVQGDRQRLASDTELALFRICQEALHNVERHSKASRLRVILSYQPENIKVAILDNGRGFHPPGDGLNDENKLGLLGMHERARIVGGRLSVHSAPGSGTRVIAEVPAPRGM
jgi:PAS domain S-box-containing protein